LHLAALRESQAHAKTPARSREDNGCQLYSATQMSTAELVREIIATYERHGWHLRRVLLKPQTREQLAEAAHDLLDAAVRENDFDALWFARASHAKREAWELRLIAQHPYALFEAFEANENEEEQEQKRQEIENRMRDYVTQHET
jgi:Asp-tRNA(Asn)/Glu-tRNA(Gln) amidotransferase A subunit family amidase